MPQLRSSQRGTVIGSRILTPVLRKNLPDPEAKPGTATQSGWSRGKGAQAPFDTSKGNCADKDPDYLFAVGAAQNVVKRLCRSCPIKRECLADALDNRIEFGVWGGMTERERRALLRQHPTVESWRKLFEANKDKGMEDAADPIKAKMAKDASRKRAYRRRPKS